MLSLVIGVLYISIMKAFFTGHRDIPNIKDAINQLIDIAWERGVTKFFNGMALARISHKRKKSLIKSHRK